MKEAEGAQSRHGGASCSRTNVKPAPPTAGSVPGEKGAAQCLKETPGQKPRLSTMASKHAQQSAQNCPERRPQTCPETFTHPWEQANGDRETGVVVR